MIYLKEFATQAEYDAFVESGQMQRPNVSYVEETLSVEYKKPIQYGVFIQHIDGTLLTKEQWQSNGYANDLANGVAVVDEKASFVVAKESFDCTWSSFTNSLTPDLFTSNDEDLAVKDMDGYHNTQKMLLKDTSGAAYICANYIFPNGQKGYLPSVGELNIIVSYSDAVNSIMSVIAKAIPVGERMWASAQTTANKAWLLYWNTALMESVKYITYKARPFAMLSI